MKSALRQRMKPSIKLLVKGAAIIACLYLLILVVLILFQNKLIFLNETLDSSWKAPQSIEEVFFGADDGVKLYGLYSRPEGSKHVLLFFHGNAGNISHRTDLMQEFLSRKIGVFLIDYRGYGKSEGKPSEQGFYKDAAAAYEYLVKDEKLRPDEIVIFGKSLGAAVAVDLAVNVRCAGVIIQSAFTSIVDMAKQIYPFVPVSLLVRTKFDNLSRIKLVTAPKLFIHSRSDEVVQFEQGERLFNEAVEPKRFYIIQNALHNNAYIVAGEEYFSAVTLFLNSLH
ncbi:MAG: alpha/beta hydrolase [Planctomycetes bacterium]|nr:alpha/beta hydrolase [Planctomycetota bacterium]